ncbi:hypothetical protein QE152_g12830 [Popillia japonica]|uniref:Reverse transcriptase Ty1/copia-type domain-containing protein n=1 Tax=Popillia japonica TaxID=7064 RepID=A0AAW1LGL0_POPJA
MKDMGEIKNCLGFRITGDREYGKIWIDQEDYLRQVLDRFHMSSCNPISTPVDTNVKLEKKSSCNPISTPVDTNVKLEKNKSENKRRRR